MGNWRIVFVLMIVLALPAAAYPADGSGGPEEDPGLTGAVWSGLGNLNWSLKDAAKKTDDLETGPPPDFAFQESGSPEADITAGPAPEPRAPGKKGEVDPLVTVLNDAEKSVKEANDKHPALGFVVLLVAIGAAAAIAAGGM